MKIILLLLIGLLVVILVRVRLSGRGSAEAPKTVKSRGKKSVPHTTAVKSPFSAVSIEFSGEACAAARELKGKRFLESEAPITPLEGCNLPRCRCRYVHYPDRRSSEDRRDPLGSAQGFLQTQGGVDRRHASDRRKADPTETDATTYRDLLSSALEENEAKD